MSAHIVTQCVDDFDSKVIERARARIQSAESAIYSNPGKNAAFRAWRQPPIEPSSGARDLAGFTSRKFRRADA
jgi:hypothetical protein